ncbi:probable 3-hydroxyacyl-CoA dehydrogenase B0272.3 [Diorhabda carinulata]|uniref:probable 3-hydroxyacyl-CoA dehydrogenase B0272.3 n=1 Tax=Diorhabda carinulata TaxID=1163345 RepID=UPI0025A0AB5B|nr:probable 3-hydroxyacyl-CoA dehydrogenase B0272.3 [Diorhabda carinulata]
MATIGNMLKRSFSTNVAKHAIQNVTIIGGGLMGSGIAQVTAQAGQSVTLVDVSNEILKKSETAIQTSIARVAKKLHKDDPTAAKQLSEGVLSRIKYVHDTEKSVENADLIIEAIIENIEIKHKLFKVLDQAAPKNTLFASNTSSLSIAEIASVTKRKDKFGGLHFFNPVPVMKLLEVIRIPETSDETYNSMMAWGKSIGKTCITCKDTPGFVVNRLLVPYIAEAVRMLERGDASAEDIDIAMKLGAGYPMGPLELADYTGLDTGVFILEGWHKKFPDNPLFKPVELQKKLVEQGKLGRKSGEGFYKYSK